MSKYPILDDISVPEDVLENWQITANLLAEIAEVPAVLIMRVHVHEIEVFVASHSPGNVYHPSEKASLDTGLYCEMVMSTRRKLLVPNALKDPDWDHNPDIDLGMISYCGLPITWPNGNIFGTICMLDEKENAYFQRAHHLMERFRDSIQQSLVNIYESNFARSQRDEAKDALRISEERLRLATNAGNIGVWDWDVIKNELLWDDSMYANYGIREEDFGGAYDAWTRTLHPDDRQFTEGEIQAALRGEREYAPAFRVVRPDGTVRNIQAASKTFRDQNGKPLRMIGTNIDITERKQFEEEKLLFDHQLQQTQKLESLGVLSGGIAHDFNNILAIIKGNCALAAMDSENTENYITEIDKASDRAAALCRQMLTYAGKAQLTKTQVNMLTLVDEMANMLKTTLPQNAVIKPNLATDLPFINADVSQIRQIVMNLIINASEAIGKVQGEINVSLARTTIAAGSTEKDYNGKLIPPGKYICLEVTDNGCGMDEQTKWRIFEPFYTTKFTGRGLGMSAVLGIINSHNGALQLYSQLGHGSTFKVYLPVPAKDSTGDENQSSSTSSAPWKGSGTILLVEDEDLVRLIAKALLKNFGFTVLEAVNGREALELYQRNATDIALVMTDMGMPIMDGYELFSELKRLNPELPIIVSSGYGDAEVGSRLGTDNISGLISKPYGPDQLREVLKRVLEDEVTEVE